MSLTIKKKIPIPIKTAIKSIRDSFLIIKNKQDIERNLDKTKKKIKNEEKIKVVFVIQFPEMWNSENSVFQNMIEDNRFDVSIFAVPKKHNDEDNQEFKNNDAYDYFSKNKIHAINAKIDNEFVPIPDDVDFIFVQRPYDSLMPKCYQMKNLSEKGLVCYIPYSGRMTNGVHLKGIEFNKTLLIESYSIFADCQDSYNYAMEWNKKHQLVKHKKVYNIGFPRFDLISTDQVGIKERPTSFLWLPRWALAGYNGKSGNSHFLDYVDILIDYFVANPSLSLTIRPHPLMFSNFMRIGVMTAEDIQRIKNKVEIIQNIVFDEEKDYLETFKKVDCLIADGTSLLLEFFCTGKPIIRCYDEFEQEDLTTEAKKMVSTFYKAFNKEDLIFAIQYLLSGQDKYIETRQEIIKNVFKIDGHVGERIKNVIIDDINR